MEEIVKILPRYKTPISRKGGKKKTHEEYVIELSYKNPNLEVIGKYINKSTKILHRCIRHNIYWDTSPALALSGVGCKLCKSEKFKKNRTKTHEQYIEEVHLISPYIDVIDKYIDARTPITHYCNIHNVKWFASPTNIIRGNGCKECGNEKTRQKLIKTHNQYINEVAEINPNIIVLEQYTGANNAIMHKCLIDKYEWRTRPAEILSGSGCPLCAGNIKRTHEQYVKDVFNINPNIEVIDEYINAITPILHKCKKHNIKWVVSPSSILQGSSCYECGIEKLSSSLSLSHEEYVNKLEKCNFNICVIGQYINSCTPILHKCLIDEYEWMARPGNILSGYGCPKCNESKGEKQITQWLNRNNIQYISQKKFTDCKDKQSLPFDFYLPKYNSCVEYDGKQHFEPTEFFGGQEAYKLRKKHDNIKTEYCKTHGISLLRIPYYKFDNIEEELNNFLFI